MSAILKIFPDDMIADRTTWWVILECQHWYHWTGDSVPAANGVIPCPNCAPIAVVTHSEPVAAASPLPAGQMDEQFDGWVPEFTVWVVRRGKRFPMVIDSIFHDDVRAKMRAKVLGQDWHVEPYRHLTASKPTAPPKASE